MMDTRQDLGMNVRAIREAQGVTQTELAAKANISRGTLHRIENTALNVSLTTLASIADALGVKLEKLLTNDGLVECPACEGRGYCDREKVQSLDSAAALRDLQDIYIELLSLPPESRLALNRAMAMCRNAIAAASGQEEQVVQEYFEAKVFKSQHYGIEMSELLIYLSPAGKRLWETPEEDLDG